MLKCIKSVFYSCFVTTKDLIDDTFFDHKPKKEEFIDMIFPPFFFATIRKFFTFGPAQDLWALRSWTFRGHFTGLFLEYGGCSHKVS